MMTKSGPRDTCKILPKYRVWCDACAREVSFKDNEIDRDGRLAILRCPCGSTIRLGYEYTVPELSSQENSWLWGFLHRDGIARHVGNCNSAIDAKLEDKPMCTAVSVLFNYLTLCIGDFNLVTQVVQSLCNVGLAVKVNDTSDQELVWLMADLCMFPVPKDVAYVNKQGQTVVRDANALYALSSIPASTYKCTYETAKNEEPVDDRCETLAENILGASPEELILMGGESDKILLALRVGCVYLGQITCLQDKESCATAILETVPPAEVSRHADAKDNVAQALEVLWDIM